MKKYNGLYRMVKRQYEVTLQRYQKDHLNEVEIMSLRKMCRTKGAKADTKADAKQMQRLLGVNTTFFWGSKLVRWQKLIRSKNYHNIALGSWKKIKIDMAKLTSYNNKTKEMRDKTEKLTKSGYNHFVSCMMRHEEMVAEKTALKKK